LAHCGNNKYASDGVLAPANFGSSLDGRASSWMGQRVYMPGQGRPCSYLLQKASENHFQGARLIDLSPTPQTKTPFSHQNYWGLSTSHFVHSSLSHFPFSIFIPSFSSSFLIPGRLHLNSTHTRHRHRLLRLPFSFSLSDCAHFTCSFYTSQRALDTTLTFDQQKR